MRARLIGLVLCASSLSAAAQGTLQQLSASGGVPCEQFGHGLAMEGSRIVVGAAAASDGPPLPCATGPGAVYVFDRQGTAWSQTQRFSSSDGSTGDEFGNSVSVSGDRIVVGAEFHDGTAGPNSGAAYVFELQGTTWTEVAKLEPSDTVSQHSFARSVAISGDWIVAGTRFDKTLGNRAGAAYTFKRDGAGNWAETQKLLASDGEPNDLYGNASAIDGNTMIVGAYFKDEPGANKQGACYVYELQGGTWVETQKIVPTPSLTEAGFGRSVSVHGDTILVGARSLTSTGSAYFYERVGGTWSQSAAIFPTNGVNGDQFGESVSVRGDYAVVGARNALEFRGRSFMYERSGTTWSERAELASPTGQVRFGYNVAISLDAAAVGAPFDNGAAGTTRVYSVPQTSGPEPPVNYCTAGTSASGCQALIAAAGTPSATATSGFDLSAAGVEGDKDGLFFIGLNGRQANTWGSGTSYICVVPPVFRGGLLLGSGTPGSCDGTFTQDWNALWCSTCPKPAKNPGAGALVQAQLWYRDPFNTSNQTTSLSDAVEFTVEP